jgi:hypothetical protein
MSRLTAAERRALPSSSFAIPSERKFPIEDEGHRRAAMGRLGTPAAHGHESQIKSAVKKRGGFGGHPIRPED